MDGKRGSEGPKNQPPKHDLPAPRENVGTRDFFGADLRRTKARGSEIRAIFENLQTPLEKFGLRTGYFQLLVSSAKTFEGKAHGDQYIPFFDVGIVPEAVFNLPDELRDAFVARTYFRSIVANPIGRIIREEFTEIGDTVGAFFERATNAKQGAVRWNIPRADSPIIDHIIYKEGPKFLISLPEHTEPKRARAMLRQMYQDIRGQKNESYFVADTGDPHVVVPIPQEDRVTYGALLFCALGERLQKDWKSNETKFGYWKPQWEEAAAHFLAVKMLDLSAAFQRDLGIDENARASVLSLKGRAVLPMITKFKRGARLEEFFPK